MIPKHSIHSFRASEMWKGKDRIRKNVTRILVPYVRVLYWAQFSIGQSARTVVRADRGTAERRRGLLNKSEPFLAIVINRKVPLSPASLPPSGPCALVFPQLPHAKKVRLAVIL
jgi:hypothetical protein